MTVFIRKVNQIGSSKHVTIPAEICNQLAIEKGTLVTFECANGAVSIIPAAIVHQDTAAAGDVNKL